MLAFIWLKWECDTKAEMKVSCNWYHVIGMVYSSILNDRINNIKIHFRSASIVNIAHNKNRVLYYRFLWPGLANWNGDDNNDYKSNAHQFFIVLNVHKRHQLSKTIIYMSKMNITSLCCAPSLPRSPFDELQTRELFIISWTIVVDVVVNFYVFFTALQLPFFVGLLAIIFCFVFFWGRNVVLEIFSKKSMRSRTFNQSFAPFFKHIPYQLADQNAFPSLQYNNHMRDACIYCREMQP